MANTKDVHKTGALAAVLSQGLVKRLDDFPTTSNLIAKESFYQPAMMGTNTFLLEVSPDECIPWKYSDRLSYDMGDIGALAESIKHSGQQEPGLVRPLQNSSHKYEIIFGNRRWQACKQISSKFTVIVKDINDQNAALYQNEENAHRKNLSEYSKALYYKKLLDEKVFTSEIEMCQKLSIARSKINDLLAYTRVPSCLVEKISNFHKLPQSLVIKLASLCKNDEYLQILLTIAPDIESRKVTKKNIEDIVKNRNTTDDITYTKKSSFCDDIGNELFYIESKKDGTKSIILNKSLGTEIIMDDIFELLKNYFKHNA